MFIFPLIAAVVSLIFGILVLRQYLSRRKPFQLFWTLGLFMFFVGSSAETIATLTTWTDLLAKIYYFFGAMITVGFLAMGTIYLLTSPKVARICLTILLLISTLAFLMILTVTMNTTVMQQAGWEWKEVMPVSARLVPITINSLGSLVLIGGALYSAWVTWRQKQHYERMIANILIASGVLVIGAAHTMGGLFGLGRQTLISIAMAIGVTLMFLGFLEAGRPTRQ